MQRFALAIISTMVIFMSCNRSINQSEVSKTLYNFDFKVIPQKTYFVESESYSNNHLGEKKSKLSFTIYAKDSNEVVLNIEDMTVDVKSELLREKMKENGINIDSIEIKGPAYCKIKNLKEIEKNNFEGKNENSATHTIGCIMLWNQQLEFPKGQLMINDSISVTSSINNAGLSTKTVFKLNEVRDNIAYFSFTKYDQYNNERAKKRLAFLGQNKKMGFLEYDLKQNYYRLIENITAQTINRKFETPEESDPDKLPDSTRFTDKSTVKISILE